LSTEEHSYGYRLFDDYAGVYDNTWDSIPENDMEILKKVVESVSEEGQAILNHVAENYKGITIGGSYYTWDEIKHILLYDVDSENSGEPEEEENT
jgi:hypothetical protein